MTNLPLETLVLARRDSATVLMPRWVKFIIAVFSVVLSLVGCVRTYGFSRHLEHEESSALLTKRGKMFHHSKNPKFPPQLPQTTRRHSLESLGFSTRQIERWKDKLKQ
jgi:hypothetical protein